MVSSKGISLRVVSQLEARQLPEYISVYDMGTAAAAIHCYIPIYPGAQVWLEYWIDAPHAPGSAWLFKLFVDGHHVTNWDCTARDDYFGKTAYSLHTAPYGLYGQHQPMQSSFRFGQFTPETAQTGAGSIEVRVHRIAKRQRIRNVEVEPPAEELKNGIFRVLNGGLSEIGRPAKRYQYLLLDPQDAPYTTFRIRCLPPKDLEIGYLLVPEQSPSTTSDSTSNYFDAETSPSRGHKNRSKRSSPASTSKMGLHESRELSSVARDSVEDLHSPVSTNSFFSPLRSLVQRREYSPTRSPAQASSPTLPEDDAAVRPRGSRAISPTRRFAKVPSRSISEHSALISKSLPLRQAQRSASEAMGRNSSTSNQQDIPRPLSPFTRAGFLRRLRRNKED